MLYASRPVVDAVVITWNRWELSRQCIEHLYASSVDVHVIIVDNGSEDGTPEHVRELFPDAELIEFEENRGYGAAANVGVEHSKAEFVSIVNSDALLAPDFFERVIARMDDPKVGFASGLSINPATGLVDSAGAIFDRGVRWSPYLSGVKPEDALVDESVLASPPTDSIVFRRKAFQGIGGFDPEIFAYGEDLDLTLRLYQAGWKPALEPTALVEHVGAASLGKRSVGQMKLVGFGRGYVAGRYRLGILTLLFDLLMWIAISATVRSAAPLGRLIAGWRRGRSLPARKVPDSIHTESSIASLLKRRDAVD